MLKEGESETIADYQNRFVFNPKAPSVNQINHLMYDRGQSDGWNNCMSYLKSVGKI